MSISYRDLSTQLTTSDRRLALLPVGCYEQHGPELPLGTDSLVAERLSHDLAERLSPWVTHVFPPVHYTPTEPNRDFCGTVHVSNQVARAYFGQVFDGIMRHPFDALVVVNGHGSVSPVLKEVSFSRVFPQFEGPGPRRPILCLDAFEFSSAIAEEFGQAPGRHAEWTEFLYTYYLLGPSYYDEDKLERLEAFSRLEGFAAKQPGILGIPMERRSLDGVVGPVLPPHYRRDTLTETSARLWGFLLDCLERKARQELTDFWEGFGQDSASVNS